MAADVELMSLREEEKELLTKLEDPDAAHKEDEVSDAEHCWGSARHFDVTAS